MKLMDLWAVVFLIAIFLACVAFTYFCEKI